MAKQELVAELYYSGSWHTYPAYVRTPASISRTRPAGSEPTPFTVTLTLRGFHNPKSPLSPLYGTAGQNTPIRVSLPGDMRFYGEVASWEPERSINYDATTGKGDAWTVITATGILRRLGQGTDPLRSAMFRTMSGITEDDYIPDDYWPGEDGADATQLAAQTIGTLPAVITGAVDPAGYSGAAGSDPVPVLNAGGQISGTFTATTLATNGSGDTGWHVEFMGMIPSTLSADAAFLEIDVPSTGGNNIVLLRVTWIEASSHLVLRWQRAGDLLPLGTATLDFSSSPELHDTPALFSINISTDVVGSPGAVNANFSMWTAESIGFPALFDFGSWTAPAVPVPTTWRAMAAAGNAGWSFSHFALYTDPSAILGSTVQENARALDGHAGEQAHERIARLCREENIPLTVEGSESQLMGAQPQETLLALFAEIERSDDGLLFEPRDGYGLVYRCGRERLNRPAVLELDWAAQQVAPPLRPVLDDLSSRNDVTVKRRNGSEARAVLTSGRLSVLEPPDGIGRYTTKVDVNTATDHVLPDHARWWLHKGTVDKVRYASVTVDLTASPSFMADAAAVDVGDTITIENLPADEHQGLARLTVLGYVETIESHARRIRFDCVPAATYDVGVWGSDAKGSRWGAADSSFAAAVDDDDTAWLVDQGTDVWATSESHPTLFPAGGGPGVDVDAGGLTYQCTAIAPATADTYSRTVANSWGTNDAGHAWSAFAAGGGGFIASNFNVGSGVGTHVVPAANASRSNYLAALSLTDVEVLVTVSLPVSDITGGSVEPANILLRGTSITSFYTARVEITTAEAVLVRLYNPAGSLLASATVAGLTHSSSQALRVRASLKGTTFAMKVWPAAGTEPTYWHVTAEDATAPGPGWVGVSSGCAAGNTNTPLTFSYDNFSVIHPLRFTVVRLPDDKPHGSGDPVTVTDTGRYGI